MSGSLIPPVSDEEVLGPAPSRGGAADVRRGTVLGRWVAWLVIGLLLVAVAWGLLALVP